MGALGGARVGGGVGALAGGLAAGAVSSGEVAETLGVRGLWREVGAETGEADVFPLRVLLGIGSGSKMVWPTLTLPRFRTSRDWCRPCPREPLMLG